MAIITRHNILVNTDHIESAQYYPPNSLFDTNGMRLDLYLSGGKTISFYGVDAQLVWNFLCNQGYRLIQDL